MCAFLTTTLHTDWPLCHWWFALPYPLCTERLMQVQRDNKLLVNKIANIINSDNWNAERSTKHMRRRKRAHRNHHRERQIEARKIEYQNLVCSPQP